MRLIYARKPRLPRNFCTTEASCSFDLFVCLCECWFASTFEVLIHCRMEGRKDVDQLVFVLSNKVLMWNRDKVIEGVEVTHGVVVHHDWSRSRTVWALCFRQFVEPRVFGCVLFLRCCARGVMFTILQVMKRSTALRNVGGGGRLEAGRPSFRSSLHATSGASSWKWLVWRLWRVSYMFTWRWRTLCEWWSLGGVD